MEAEASPFPKEDKTPPVTKIYLVEPLTLVLHLFSTFTAKKSSDSSEILLRVHSDRFFLRFHHFDFVSVFQCPQLFQLLDLF